MCSHNNNIYKKCKNKLNHVIKYAKTLHYEEQLIKYKHNTKMTWRILNEILNKDKKIKELPKQFSVGKHIIKNPIKIANEFNKYFVNIGPELAEKTYNQHLTNNYKDSMFLDPITESEVEIEISNIKNNKSPGYDDINAKVIKLTGKEISTLLVHIFNFTFVHGSIPGNLKIALVTPIFKANEKNYLENYRPISGSFLFL